MVKNKMAMVEIQDEIHREVTLWVETHKVDFPSIRNFVDKSCRERLKYLKKVEEKQND